MMSIWKVLDIDNVPEEHYPRCSAQAQRASVEVKYELPAGHCGCQSSDYIPRREKLRMRVIRKCLTASGPGWHYSILSPKSSGSDSQHWLQPIHRKSLAEYGAFHRCPIMFATHTGRHHKCVWFGQQCRNTKWVMEESLGYPWFRQAFLSHPRSIFGGAAGLTCSDTISELSSDGFAAIPCGVFALATQVVRLCYSEFIHGYVDLFWFSAYHIVDVVIALLPTPMLTLWHQ